MIKFRKSIAIGVLVTNACYTTVPLTTEHPIAGTELVVTLTDLGGPQMASVLGPKVTGLSGKFLSETGDSLYLGVATVMQTGGNEQFWQGERVGIPRSIIATLRERKGSTAKSALLVGAVVAVLASITALVSSGNPGTGSTPPPKGQ